MVDQNFEFGFMVSVETRFYFSENIYKLWSVLIVIVYIR